MYTLKTSIRLHDTDAAGLLFFAHQFKLAHDAYEGFMEEIGFGFASIIREAGFLVPIVHAEADYKTGLSVGDKVTIRLRTVNVGNSSFTLAYDLLDSGDRAVGSVKTVHVCMDKETRKKKPLPDGLRRALEGNS